MTKIKNAQSTIPNHIYTKAFLLYLHKIFIAQKNQNKNKKKKKKLNNGIKGRLKFGEIKEKQLRSVIWICRMKKYERSGIKQY